MAIIKVADLPYKRYTIEEGKAAFEKFEAAMKEAMCANCVMRARKAFREEMRKYETQYSLAYCRYTLNTKDEFYKGEMDYYDNVGPLFSEIGTSYAALMLDSPYRADLEKKLGSRLFKMWEIARKTFSPEIIPDLQEENTVVTEYSQLMSTMVFVYDGKEMPLSVLRGKLEDADRSVRKAAAVAIGEGLERNSEKLDEIYDRLVKIRDRIAKKLGYKTFTELGYYRMGRLDYDEKMVASFRENVRKSLVPVVNEIKNKVKNELGYDSITFYDNDIYGSGSSIVPILDKDGMFIEAQKMYDSMNPEIGEFMRQMIEAEAFDVESRDGKWGGGYCTVFESYKQPFILANFNGTTGDVDVLTHEFGHAFAMKKALDKADCELGIGGSETAECHSMSMEFFSWPSMNAFFGEDGDRYRRKHLISALDFIPYGVMVDEFQHEIYANPDLTPAERKNVWLNLEKKYRPYMDYDNLPYLSLGTRWQYQMHIYESPFYYIDYCLAQTVAIGFLCASRENYDAALDAYIKFCQTGGEISFPELIENAGLSNPFEDGALDKMAKKTLDIINSFN